MATRTSDPSPLRRAAAVVRNRGDVADRLHLDADRLQRADGGLAAGAGPLHAHVDRAQSVRLGPVAGVDGRLRRRERRALARALEADAAGARPRDDVPLLVGDRDLRVVEGGVNVRQSVMDDALLAALLERLARGLLAALALFLSCFRLRHTRLHRLLLGYGTLARALARARVGARPLPAHRQVAAMTQAAVAADFHQPLDVHGDLLAEIALHAADLFEHPADLADVVFGQILDADVRADARRGQDVVRPLAPDAVDIREADLDPLRPRQIDACNTRHRLPLPLLVLRVRADHTDDATSPHNLALVTDPLDRRSYLHVRPSSLSGRASDPAASAQRPPGHP